MAAEVNRAIALWRNWEAKEKMLLEVFGHGKISENLGREKLEFLSAGMQRISSASPDEKLVLAIIRKSIRRLEKELYPHPVVRLANKIKRLVLDQPLVRLKEGRLKKRNMAALDKVTSGLGIDTTKLNLKRALDFQRQQVDISLSSLQRAGKRFEMVLHLEKDVSGQFKLQGYSGKLENTFDPESNRSFGFDVAMDISSQEALNLLQGRAVLKDFGVGGISEAKWLQLDFTSLNAPLLREFGKADGFDLGKQMEQIAGGLNRPELLSSHILKAMERGNHIAVNSLSGEKILLEASPLSGKILLRDERLRVVSLEKVIRKKEKSLEIKPELKISKVQQKQQTQSLGIA
ncbi:hypothetical protein ASU31_10605 [Pedobacter ginsenosidimutans]|uniref:Uncharacterized protein n=1 Tax=Pedobacter ginsenosidimutans TaxID=687842 RepID=A0A0T5VQG3_9SPHI|nr:hypothetical protein [Pedobacter ginsenosidimutans]KRT15951.1 hypothetical protein ASU31_10605 [Pedobacter ginsenosidimutans]